MDDSPPHRRRQPSRLARVALVLLPLGLGVCFVVARREVWLTLHNQSSATLRNIRVEFGGRVTPGPDLVAGGSTTLNLGRSGSPFAPPVIRHETADGSTYSYSDLLDTPGYWVHIELIVTGRPGEYLGFTRLVRRIRLFVPLEEMLAWARGL